VITALIETNVVVDVIRRYLPALSWLQAQNQPTLGITPIIWMEVIAGGPTKIRRLRAAKFMAAFDMIYLTQADLDWAMQTQMRHELSHGVGMMDSLIASGSHRLQIPLYTHNLKHFAPLLGNLAQKPY
jgi:predicted nucleic acid-binding protein